ncbi:MAG: glycosyltransferase family 4 protein [Deltaproteobacteria bacterium]|nr:glycosyltransferase family 4 protein [Candidatus Tharpellaceae bacterium]
MKICFILDETWDSALTDFGLKSAAVLSKRYDVIVGAIKHSFAFQTAHERNLETFDILPLRGNIFSSLKTFLFLKNKLSSIRPDIVVSIRGEAFLFSCILRKKLGFYPIRIYGEDKNWHFSLHNLTFRDCSFIFSSYKLWKSSPFKNRKVTIVRGMVDEKRFSFKEDGMILRKRMNIRDDEIVFGAVGRWDKVKGYPILIDAFYRLNKELPKTKLAIVGEKKREDVEGVIGKIEEYGLRDKIFLDFEKKEDISVFMSAVDVGVISSISSEVIARVPLEFMSVGKPIVATRVGVLPEIIKSSFGLIAEPDVEGLYQKMKEITKMDLRQMGKNARKEIEENYSSSVFLCQWEKLIQADV